MTTLREVQNLTKELCPTGTKSPEPFRRIIDGRSNCGKTRLLIELLKEFRQRETFDKIIIICPTFPRNKTYQSEEFIFKDTNILVCDWDFDDVEQYIKISRCFINSKPSIENALKKIFHSF